MGGSNHEQGSRKRSWDQDEKQEYKILKTSASQSATTPASTAVLARERWTMQEPCREFQMVGVSFAGENFDGTKVERQAVLSKVKVGDVVVVARTPWNGRGHCAIGVFTLGGQSLGNVPREENEYRGSGHAHSKEFPHEVVLGRIASVGHSSQSGLLGARVSVRPDIPAVVPLQLPTKHAKLLDPYQLIKKCPAWASAAEAAVEEAGGKCSVSGRVVGKEKGEKLVPLPVWRYNTAQCQVQLVGAQAVCEEVAKVLCYALPAPELLATLGRLNGLRSRELKRLVAWTDVRQSTMDGQGWDVALM